MTDSKRTLEPHERIAELEADVRRLRAIVEQYETRYGPLSMGQCMAAAIRATVDPPFVAVWEGE